MTYVRIDTKTEYIYFENDTLAGIVRDYANGGAYVESIYRSQYTLEDFYECIRMTKKQEIPNNKKVNVWYKKGVN